MTTLEIVVPAGKARERLDIFLTHHVEGATRSKLQNSITNGAITVNGKQVKPSHKVSPGEIVHIESEKPPPTEVVAENIPLTIIYEDEYLLVVNKPAGMVTHPACGNYSGTLVNALLYHYNNHLSSVNDPTRPGIVHRLDKDTSGLMVVAKTDNVHALLAKQFLTKTIRREYWAIVWGVFSNKKKSAGQYENTGVIEAALGRSKSDRKKIAVTRDGKEAITEYQVLEEFPYLSLVLCRLQTGRTHQIRVHMHHIGHPVLGDATYGGRKISWGDTDPKKRQEIQQILSILDRQALHAKSITFFHPVLKQQISFESDLPDDIEQVLKILHQN